MKAYMTLLSDESYLPGVLALKKCLDNVNSQYDFICILSAKISEECRTVLIGKGVACIRLQNSCLDDEEYNIKGVYSHWANTFDKLQIWSFVKYQKIVFLDSDLFILQNIDNLFDKENFSAVCAGCSKPGRIGWRGLNSGVIVIKPDLEVYASLKKLAKEMASNFAENSPLGDQDVINYYLPDWYDDKSHVLDEGYNIFAEDLDFYIKNRRYTLGENKDAKPIFIVHYIGKYKPWMKGTFRNKLWVVKKLLFNKYYRCVFFQYRKILQTIRDK